VSSLASLLISVSLLGLSPSDDGTVDCGRLADVPRPAIRFEPGASKTPLRRAYSLQKLFSEGEGSFAPGEPDKDETMESSPIPWRSAPGRERNLRLVTWQDADSGNDENMPAIVLEPGASWCTPPLELAAGARLRFEAMSPGEGKLHIEAGSSSALLDDVVARPESLFARRQTDLEIEEGRRALCFRATKAPVALGEARVLVPEDGSSDSRPRWIVLTIVDALRADTLDILPSLGRLAEKGLRYTKAISPGCHTRASVWPILMGRDLMRIDPLQRRQSMPIQAPLEAIYSRGNLFIGHLAEAAGYHSVFLGNNAYLRAVPAFSRYSSRGRTDSGTIDTMEKLPDVLSRYADERVLLVYYVSTPHAHSETPRRLYDELRCSELRGLDECRCRYQARARHADEALETLQSGLRAHGLEGRVLQVVTADHGELFGEGRKLEGEIQNFETGEKGGAFASFDRGHGYACHERETDVPLVVHGPGVAPGRWDGVVSGLDIVPTLLEAMRLAPPGKLDGSPLPLLSGPKTPPRTLVAHGFCSDSRIEGDKQLIWWIEGCRVREQDGTPLAHRAEIWSGGNEVATEKTDPARLESFMKRHESWLLERLPFDTFVFGVDRLEDATIRVEVANGRIVDYGPAGSVYDLDKIELLGLSENKETLRVRFHGYHGLYHLSTLPPRARVKVEVEGHPDVVTFVGPLQLPLPIAGHAVDPESDLTFLLASEPPPARAAQGPSLRFWWQSYQRSEHEAARREMTDFDRVLREWGYIR
jgi:arylsulfatase A-like enzyme